MNDLFSIFGKPDMEVASMNLSIFDRWGNLVFQSSQYPTVWNGQSQDRELNPGVFTYTVDIDYSIANKEYQFVKTGDVLIVR